MILRRAERFIARELWLTQAAVSVVLLLVIIGGVLARVLRDVAEGSLPVDFLPGMVAFGAFKGIVFLWPVALFLAFMLVFGRMQRDSEMTALQASGMSFAALYRALFWVAAPAAILLLVLMTMVVPRTEAQIDQLRDLAEQRSDLVGIAPGRFLRSRVGDQVFFAERMSEDREALLEVFIYREVDGESQITVAERAVPDPEAEGSGFLLLENGYRYVGEPGTASFRMLEFERLRTQITEPDPTTRRASLDALPTSALWAQRDDPERAPSWNGVWQCRCRSWCWHCLRCRWRRCRPAPGAMRASRPRSVCTCCTQTSSSSGRDSWPTAAHHWPWGCGGPMV